VEDQEEADLAAAASAVAEAADLAEDLAVITVDSEDRITVRPIITIITGRTFLAAGIRADGITTAAVAALAGLSAR
jgi:hypothetical protein